MTKTIREKLQDLDKDQLINFLSKEAAVDEDLSKRLEMVINIKSPDYLVKVIQSDINAIARGTRFIDWREAYIFSQSLSRIITDIEHHLLNSYASQAIAVLDKFFAKAEKIINRCDDSDGSISGEFHYAIEVWGKAWANLASIEPKAFTQAIWHYLSKNDCGLFDHIIPACAAALEQVGYEALYELLYKNHTKKGVTNTVFFALKDLALLRQSPEAFTEAFALTKNKISPPDQLELARLFLKRQRANEAIAVLQSIDKNFYDKRQQVELLIEAYSSINEFEKVQALRWQLFLDYLDIKAYQNYLTDLPTDAQQVSAKEEAIKLALNQPDLISGLSLLIHLDSIKLASHHLRERYEELDGRRYNTLKDIAKLFAKACYPLDAILIYRCLNEDILNRAQSKYYDYAISYLKKTKDLAPFVENWSAYPNTEDYFACLQNQHRRKPAFMIKLKEIK